MCQNVQAVISDSSVINMDTRHELDLEMTPNVPVVIKKLAKQIEQLPNCEWCTLPVTTQAIY